MKRASGVVVRVGVGTAALLAMACASEPGGGEAALSPEMRQAIDTFVELRAPIPAGSPADVARDSSSTTRETSQTSLGGLDAAQLSGALTAGASGVPVGGAAAGASAAGNGGVGAGALGPGGPASGGAAAGFGGAASGASSGGGLATFADAACYLVGRLCSYIARCVGGERVDVCAVPSACPALVADALAKSGNPPIPPQAGVVIRCVGDAIGSASCVREELASGLKSSLERCGVSRAGDL